MKIKIIINQLGQLNSGDIVDAAVSKDKSAAVAFENAGTTYWYLCSGQFEILSESQEQEQSFAGSLRELVGQDMARIEFK